MRDVQEKKQKEKGVTTVVAEKKKSRAPLAVHFRPSIASPEAQARLVGMLDLLLAELARKEVFNQQKGGQYGLSDKAG